MFISVILPVYNSEKFLEIAIKSVLGQKFLDWELIAINDGSTDNSLKILKKCKEQDKLCRIKIIDLKSNKGLGYARNKGIGIAKGRFLFFLDSDDFIEENCFSILSKKLKKKFISLVTMAVTQRGNCYLNLYQRKERMKILKAI